MTWNKQPVTIATRMEDADGDSRFYRTDQGAYFEVTQPGGGEDAALLHRSIVLTATFVQRRGARTLQVPTDIDGNFGAVTASIGVRKQYARRGSLLSRSMRAKRARCGR